MASGSLKIKKLVGTILVIGWIVFVLTDVVLGWGAVVPIAETHQYILDEAYKKLEHDPAFDGSNFPTWWDIRSYEGVKVINYDASSGIQILEGLGPDAKDRTNYSYHYYNPRTNKGEAPNASAAQYQSLKNRLEEESRMPVSRSVVPPGRAAAYLAHYVADISCPYHINGLPAAEAIDVLNSGNGLLDKKIYGPKSHLMNKVTKVSYSPLSGTPMYGSGEMEWVESPDWCNELTAWKQYYTKNELVDWFDPWYWDGDLSKDVTCTHVLWEFSVKGYAANELTGYAADFNQQNGNGKQENIREFVKNIAHYTDKHQSEWWGYFSDTADPLDQAITNVYTVWRASFSALRPDIFFEPDKETGEVKVIVKIKNLEDTEAAKNVKINLELRGGTLNGPQEYSYTGKLQPGQEVPIGTEVMLAAPDQGAGEIKPKEEVTIDGVWTLIPEESGYDHSESSDKAVVTLTVSGEFEETPDSGQAVIEKEVDLPPKKATQLSFEDDQYKFYNIWMTFPNGAGIETEPLLTETKGIKFYEIKVKKSNKDIKVKIDVENVPNTEWELWYRVDGDAMHHTIKDKSDPRQEFDLPGCNDFIRYGIVISGKNPEGGGTCRREMWGDTCRPFSLTMFKLICYQGDPFIESLEDMPPGFPSSGT